MAEKSTSYYREVFSLEEDALAADHEFVMSRFAEDWAVDQALTGISPKAYLGRFKNEFERALDHTNRDIALNYLLAHKIPIDKKVAEIKESHPIAPLMRAHLNGKLVTVRSQYQKVGREYADAFDGIPFVAYRYALETYTEGLAKRKSPADAIETYEKFVPEVDKHPVLRVAMDQGIYMSARRAPAFEDARYHISFASSEMARVAMSQALDFYVLQRAVDNYSEATGLTPTIEEIISHASSGQAQQALVDALTDPDKYSAHPSGYIDRVSYEEWGAMRTARRAIREQVQARRTRKNTANKPAFDSVIEGSNAKTEPAAEAPLIPADTTEFDNAFLGETYLRELNDIVSNHNLIAKLLAADWTRAEVDAAAQSPKSHLNLAAQEVSERTHGTFTSMYNAKNRMGWHIIKPYAEQQPKESRLNTLWHSYGYDALKLVTDEEMGPSSGLPFIIYVDALVQHAMRKAIYNDPQKAIARMEDSTDESLHPILRAVMDSQIFAGAQKGEHFTVAYAKADYASTPAMHRAMKRGLDAKVYGAAFALKYGEKRPGLPDNLPYDEFVKAYASSDTAAEMILQLLDRPAVSFKNGSEYTARVGKYFLLAFESGRMYSSQDGLANEHMSLGKRGNQNAAELVETFRREEFHRMIEITRKIKRIEEPSRD